MQRLHKWLRRRREGSPSSGGPAAAQANLKQHDGKTGSCQPASHFPLTSNPLQGIQHAAQPAAAAGHCRMTCPTPLPASSYSVAAGAGILPGEEDPGSTGSGATPPLPNMSASLPSSCPSPRRQDRGVCAGQTATIHGGVSASPQLHGWEAPLERESARSSRHDSSRSFPAGDMGSGTLEGQWKSGVNAEDMLLLGVHSGGEGSRHGLPEPVDRGGGYGGSRSEIGGSSCQHEPVSMPGAQAAEAASTAAAPGEGVIEAAAGSSGALAALGTPRVSSVVAAAEDEAGVEPPPTPQTVLGPPAAALPSPHNPLATALPPRRRQPSHGSVYNSRPLFESSYQEREVEQRLRRVVFGSFNQRSTAAVPASTQTLWSCSSCGGLDAARGSGTSPDGFGSSSSGGAAAPSHQLARSTAEVPTAAVGYGSKGCPSARPGGPGWAPYNAVPGSAHLRGAYPAAQPPGYPRGHPNDSCGGGAAAISARDLLLGRAPSPVGHQCDAHRRPPGPVVTTSTSHINLPPPPALPLPMAAVSVPLPPLPVPQLLTDAALPGPSVTTAAAPQPGGPPFGAAPRPPPLQLAEVPLPAVRPLDHLSYNSAVATPGLPATWPPAVLQPPPPPLGFGGLEAPRRAPVSGSALSEPGCNAAQVARAAASETRIQIGTETGEGPGCAAVAKTAAVAAVSPSNEDPGSVPVPQHQGLQGELQGLSDAAPWPPVAGAAAAAAPMWGFEAASEPSFCLQLTRSGLSCGLDSRSGAAASSASTAVAAAALAEAPALEAVVFSPQPVEAISEGVSTAGSKAAAVSEPDARPPPVAAAAPAAVRDCPGAAAAATAAGRREIGLASAAMLAAHARARGSSGGGAGAALPQPGAVAAVLACLSAGDEGQTHDDPAMELEAPSPPAAAPPTLPPPPPVQQQQQQQQPESVMHVQSVDAVSSTAGDGMRASQDVTASEPPAKGASYRLGSSGGGSSGAANPDGASAQGRPALAAIFRSHDLWRRLELPFSDSALKSVSDRHGSSSSRSSRSSRFRDEAPAAAGSTAAGVAAALGVSISGLPEAVRAKEPTAHGAARLRPRQQRPTLAPELWADLNGGARDTPADMERFREKAAELGSEARPGAGRATVHAALLAPRVWPASGAAGPEGPLARCVAERLMTRNPLFRTVGDESGTPEGLDSGTEGDS